VLSCSLLGITTDGAFYFRGRRGRWWEEMDGIECYRTYMHGMPRIVKYNKWRWVSIVRSMYEDYKKRYGTPDVLHAHCAKWGGVAARLIAQEEQIPYFVTEHFSRGQYEADFGMGWTKHEWAKDLIRRVWEDAACVIPVADEMVQNLELFFGASYRHHTISNIIDTSFYAYRDRETLTGRKFRFCILARGDIYGKGFDVLAKAYRHVKGCELHIAGTATDTEAMRGLFAGCDGVTIHGRLDKYGVRDLLYHCDALVLPSRSEVQPLVVLEAMATGIPVIGSEVIPMSERIPRACIIVPVADAGALMLAMTRLAGTGKATARQAYSDAVKNIASMDVVGRQLEQVFMKGMANNIRQGE
jgi:glycosyltransferase involved in cell wall biosynthesis